MCLLFSKENRKRKKKKFNESYVDDSYNLSEEVPFLIPILEIIKNIEMS